MNSLRPNYAVRTGVQKIARGAVNLADIAEATLNNANERADRDALKEIKRQLESVRAVANMLEDLIQMRVGKQ